MHGVNVLWVAKYSPIVSRGMSHKHEFYQFTCPISHRMIVNEEEYISRGEAMLAKPGEYHSFFSTKDGSAAVVFDCKFTVSSPELHSALVSVPLKISLEKSNSVYRLIDHILNEATEKRAFYQENIDALFASLLIEMLRGREGSGEKSFEVHSDREGIGLCGADTDELREHIDNNIGSISTLDDLAAHLHINKTTLTEIFKGAFGMTPMRYVNYRRYEAGKRLLLETSLSVSEIAERTGFGSIHYFSKIFKERSGVSPVAFRKRGVDTYIDLPHSQDYDHRKNTTYK